MSFEKKDIIDSLKECILGYPILKHASNQVLKSDSISLSFTLKSISNLTKQPSEEPCAKMLDYRRCYVIEPSVNLRLQFAMPKGIFIVDGSCVADKIVMKIKGIVEDSLLDDDKDTSKLRQPKKDKQGWIAVSELTDKLIAFSKGVIVGQA